MSDSKVDSTAESLPLWRPILESELATRAWRAIDAVTRDLERRGLEDSLRSDLAGGTAGLALYFAYLAAVCSRDGGAKGRDAFAREDGERYAARASDYLDHAIEAIASTALPPHLYSGFFSVGWAADHLKGRLFESEGGEDENEIDQALILLLDGRSWSFDYDLISGLAGYAVYALEGLPRPSARRALELVVDQLALTATEHDGGFSWFTAPELLPPEQRTSCPKGYFNVGLAHGMPAVIAVLAQAARKGISEERVLPLLDGAVRWLLAQELPENQESLFPNWVSADLEPVPSRSAWCYGDPGIAAALFLAARTLGRGDWEKEALRIARAAAARPAETSKVADACICHGAAGLGHLFNRFYQATGEEAFLRAARFWFEQTLEMWSPGQGVGGFLSLTTAETGEQSWVEDQGFLMGSSGMALALLGAVSSVEPEWDRMLLVSIPPRARD